MNISTRPNVSELQKDGTRIVNVYNRNACIRQDFRVTNQEADEFISHRKEELKKASKKNLFATIAPLSLCVIGATSKSKGTWPLAAMFGGLIGSILGFCFTSTIKTDKKVSEEFIQKQLAKKKQ